MKTPACALCRFWEETRDDGNGILGDCRIEPPRLARTPHWRLQGVWPETYGQDWCGRWQEREGDDA